MVSIRKKHPEAYSYVSLLWTPRVGHRVEYKGVRYEVTRVFDLSEEIAGLEGRSVLLKNHTGAFYPGELKWRPEPKDFDAVLLNLKDLWAYHQTDGSRHIVGITCNGRTMPLRGRAVQILSRVLSLRVVDSKISVTINRLFESSYSGHATQKGGHAIRFHNLSTKGSGPT